MEDKLLKHLTRRIMVPVSGAVRNAVNKIDGLTAWSGIRDDKKNSSGKQKGISNAEKAFQNHYGFITPLGKVPPRPYIDSAVDDNVLVKAGHTKMALRRAVLNEIRDSDMGRFATTGDWVYPKSGGESYLQTKRVSPTRAFGVHTTANAVMLELAKQMNENQKRAMVRTEENSEFTLRRKRKRSQDPLVDYGDMRKATRYGIE